MMPARLSIRASARVCQVDAELPLDTGGDSGGDSQRRYIVNDVDEAISFYRLHLDFKEVMHPAPTFAMLSNG